MLSGVVEDEPGREQEYEEGHCGTEDYEHSLGGVVRHPEERSTFQKKILRYSIKGLSTWIEGLMRSLGMSSLFSCLVNTD